MRDTNQMKPRMLILVAPIQSKITIYYFKINTLQSLDSKKDSKRSFELIYKRNMFDIYQVIDTIVISQKIH